MNKVKVDIAFTKLMNLARDYDAVRDAGVRDYVKDEIIAAAYKLVEAVVVKPVTFDVPDFSEVDE